MKEELQGLLKCPGWGRLANYLNQVRIARRNSILAGNDDGLNGLIEDAKSRSELAGIEFVLGTPQALIDEAQLEIEALLQQMRDEE